MLKKVDVDIEGESKKTALHYACENNELSIVEYLF